MSLTLQSLELSNFRNYESLRLSDLGNLTIFTGKNAVGKTNIVEAIQLVTAIQSFRNPRVDHLIRAEKESGYVKSHITDGNRQLDIDLFLALGKKRYTLNGKPKQGLSLKGICPSVVFTPDDLELVKGSNSIRRDALDLVGGQISENHRVIRRDFNNILKNKNTVLKDEGDIEILRALNEVMVICSAQLTCYRAKLFSHMSEYMKEVYRKITSSNESLTCVYDPCWTEYGIGRKGDFSRDEAREWLYDCMEQNISQERTRKRAFVGAQSDKVRFLIDGRDASSFASQGQQRSLVLAFKIAEVEIVKDVLGTKPILILDDVMSELDDSRRECLIEFIEEEMQVFITTTNLGYFTEELRGRANVISLPIEI